MSFRTLRTQRRTLCCLERTLVTQHAVSRLGGPGDRIFPARWALFAPSAAVLPSLVLVCPQRAHLAVSRIRQTDRGTECAPRTKSRALLRRLGWKITIRARRALNAVIERCGAAKAIVTPQRARVTLLFAFRATVLPSFTQFAVVRIRLGIRAAVLSFGTR